MFIVRGRILPPDSDERSEALSAKSRTFREIEWDSGTFKDSGEIDGEIVGRIGVRGF